MRHPIRTTHALALLVVAATLACSDTSAPNNTLRQGAAQSAATPTLTPQQSGTINRLQAISAVNDQVAWASGVGGTYAVTTDGGTTWRSGVVPGASILEFRDVEAQSDKVAYLLAAGPGEFSRIYKTRDGGATWTKQWQNSLTFGFYDCFAFWNRNSALVMADGLNGRFPVLRTTDGTTWKNIGERLPAALPGEAAFAASGTCVATVGTGRAWIATGGAATARILATTDGGNSWNAYPTPIVQGTPSSGGVSVAFRDASHGILGGGELATPDSFVNNIAHSSDGGVSWQLGAGTPFPGSVYGLSYVKGMGTTVVATGPGGAAWSSDEGNSWTDLPGNLDYWAVTFASPTAGWMVGTGGRIVKISF